jgi:hypothetical protein
MPSTFTLQKAQSGGDLTISTYNTTLTQIEVAVRALQDATSSNGTVTVFSAVSSALSQIFTTNVTNSTTTPALTFSVVTKAANLIYASPTTGAAAAPTFRSLVIADLPTVTFAKGGIGLTALGTAHQFPKVNAGATAYEMASITVGSNKLTVTPSAGIIALDVAPANIDKNTLGGSALSIANGGSGASTQQTAINALTAVGINANRTKVLTVNGSDNAVWATPSVGIVTINGQTGTTVTLTTDGITEGTSNLYFTDARVTNNATVVANTAKVTNATHTGDVTGATALTIAANAVTYAKFQTVGANKILGNPTNSTANASEITTCPNLLFVSGVLKQRQSIFANKATTYTMTNLDGIIYADATTAAFTVKLPQTSSLIGGEIFTIERVNSGAREVTVSTFAIDSSEIILGETSGITMVLTAIGHNITVQYVGEISSVKTFRVINSIK